MSKTPQIPLCPVCAMPCEMGSYGDMRQYCCPRCGPFQISSSAVAVLKGRSYKPNGAMDHLVVAKVSHYIRLRTSDDEWLKIHESMVDEMVAQNLPPPQNQRLNLLKWMREQAGEAHFETLEFSEKNVCSIIGASSVDGAATIIDMAVRDGLIESLSEDCYSLTTAAWEVLASTEPQPQRRQHGENYVDAVRIAELKTVTGDEFDLQRLLRMCEEINDAWRAGNTISVAMLARGIADHIPPIFGLTSFSQVASHGPKSIRGSYQHIEQALRHIADSALHMHIRRREVVPTLTQVDFRQSFDVLLGEVVRQLS